MNIVAKEAGVPFILAKSADQIHATVLKKIGADKVIVPEKESGIRVARLLMAGNFTEFIELSDKVRMIETAVKEEWIGKTLRQLNLRKKHNLNVVCARKGGEIVLNLDPDIPLTNDYSLIVIVDKQNIAKLMRK